MATNDPDFFGEGVLAGPDAPPPRATSPDGLTFLDDGSPTPLYYQREALRGGAFGGNTGTVNGGKPADMTNHVDWQEARGIDGIAGPNGVPTGKRVGGDGAPIYVSLDPLRSYNAAHTPIFSAPNGVGSSNNLNMAPLAPGDPSQMPAGQRIGTQAEANRGNAYYAATGNSNPAKSGGAAQGLDAGAAAAAAQQQFRTLASERGTQAQDMYAQGQAAQTRTAPQTTGVDYGAAPKVKAASAANVSYGAPQQIAQTQQAKAGNFGAQQAINAPTLAGAQQAAMGNFGAQQSVNAANVGAAAQGSVGNFGAQQSVNAANVGPAAYAQAQQAQATQAQNQAGFLADTAQNARGIADLDYSQANQSRGDIQQSLADVRGFLQAGPGPSMAQQQLRMGQESNLGDALSLARSGRGNAAGNMKMALSENAATNSQTNQQAALLRAQEADMWQQRQLSGLGLQSQTATNLRGQDIGAAQAQGQQAISREQIASNVDVNRASLEQALSQFNAGAVNQASLTNAQLGTQTNLQNAEQSNMGTRLQAQLSTDANIQQAGLANARNIAVGQAGTSVSMGNAEQSNLGTRLQAQLSTDAGIQQAALANSRNIAAGQAGTQTNISNAEQSNLTSRLQGQLQSDAQIQQAGLANARNIAQGQAGTQVSMSNADNAAVRARSQAELANSLAIAQGNSSTQIGTTNATNATQANMTQGELANALAIAQGNSSTNINAANLDASVKQNQTNDALTSALTGYGVDLGGQQLNATNYGAANQFDYANLGAEVDWRNLDRAAGIKSAEKDRKQKQEAAYISALAAGFESIV